MARALETHGAVVRRVHGVRGVARRFAARDRACCQKTEKSDLLLHIQIQYVSIWSYYIYTTEVID